MYVFFEKELTERLTEEGITIYEYIKRKFTNFFDVDSRSKKQAAGFMRDYESTNFASCVTTVDYCQATMLKNGRVERDDGTIGKALPRMPKIDGSNAEE